MNATAPLLIVLVALGAAPPAGLAAPAAAPVAPSAPAAAAAKEPGQQTFEEKVLVREIEVLVEIPTTLHEARRKNLGPQDFQVTEDGAFRQVVKAAPVVAGDAAPWHLVLYFDQVLADPTTLFFTANALAQKADRLTGLGTVEVVVADPRPHSVLKTQEPKALQQALIDVAAAAERRRGLGGTTAGAGAGAGARRPAATAPSVAAVKLQEDRLLALLAGAPDPGPHALVLVADGFDSSTSGGNATSATQAVAEEPGRTLAAYGWVTLAAPMRKQEVGGVEHREITDLERMRQASAGQQAPGGNTPPEIAPSLAPRSRLNYDAVISLFTEPATASLNAVAAATGGTVIGFPDQLDAAITGLGRHWHLFYLAPDPEDGRPRPVEVRLAPEGNLLRTPVWRRSSTPDEVAAARLRLLLGGATDRGTLAIDATLPTPRALHVKLAAFTPAAPTTAGPFRVSFAFITDTAEDAPLPPVTHRLLTSPDLTEKGWSADLSVDAPPAARRLALTVEDLAHQQWGATVIDLPAPPHSHP